MYYKRHAGIAQLVEHNLAKVGVASSSLVSRSRLVFEKVLVKLLIYAGIAQLVEHNLKVGVASSSLVSAPNSKGTYRKVSAFFFDLFIYLEFQNHSLP